MATTTAFNRRSFVKGAAALSLAALAGASVAAPALAKDKKDADTTTVRLGVVGAIYEDLWAPAKEKLAEEGIELEFVQFSDYVTPNNALDNGEIDLNAFQHRIYLASDAEANGYQIENVANTFIIPLNVYSQKVSSIDELQDGDTVAIPNDVTNGGRALKVLEAAGLIQISEEAGFNPTIDDIETYNVEVEILELAANVIPSSLADVTAAVVNGNYALDFGLKTEEAIYQDTVLDQKEYWNLIAARTEDVENEERLALFQKVIDAFQTEETQKVFDEEFGGYFVAVGWGESPLDETDEDEDAEAEADEKADDKDAEADDDKKADKK
jgi:D-methionine transport system substrate-binding protein